MEEHILNVRDKEVSVFLAAFRDVKNVKELKPKLMNGELDVALISAIKIVSSFQLLVAANIALHNREDGVMKTRNVNSELIFALSPGKQISEAFRQFGAGDGDSAVVAVALESSQKLTALQAALRGEPVPVAQLGSLSDHGAVRKLYQVTDAELDVGSLEEAVCNRIATRCAT